ncbi:MAG: flagellar protein [Selenomonas sp.]|nr:flagellar protein [Selenomonas sp.]
MADQRIFFPSQPLLPIDDRSPVRGTVQNRSSQEDFASILSKEKDKVVFSRHAQQRLLERHLNFSPADLARLGEAVDRLAAKGARESLVYLNDAALVVSVANRTVITAMDGTSAKNNIFMNIDSAAII